MIFSTSEFRNKPISASKISVKDTELFLNNKRIFDNSLFNASYAAHVLHEIYSL